MQSGICSCSCETSPVHSGTLVARRAFVIPLTFTSSFTRIFIAFSLNLKVGIRAAGPRVGTSFGVWGPKRGLAGVQGDPVQVNSIRNTAAGLGLGFRTPWVCGLGSRHIRCWVLYHLALGHHVFGLGSGSGFGSRNPAQAPCSI